MSINENLLKDLQLETDKAISDHLELNGFYDDMFLAAESGMYRNHIQIGEHGITEDNIDYVCNYLKSAGFKVAPARESLEISWFKEVPQ